MIQAGCFFGEFDLTGVFYSVLIKDSCRKYSKFKWLGKLFVFTRLPNGLSTARSIFVKVMKPVLGTLLKIGA